MDNHTAMKKMWCANELVGAPWACGYDHRKENFEVDVLDTYTGHSLDKSVENYSKDKITAVKLSCKDGIIKSYGVVDTCSDLVSTSSDYKCDQYVDNSHTQCGVATKTDRCITSTNTCSKI